MRQEFFSIEHEHGNEVYFVEKMFDKTIFIPSMIKVKKKRFVQKRNREVLSRKCP